MEKNGKISIGIYSNCHNKIEKILNELIPEEYKTVFSVFDEAGNILDIILEDCFGYEKRNKKEISKIDKINKDNKIFWARIKIAKSMDKVRKLNEIKNT